uniref:Uncharacterized protein n=1 Tax=Ditylum brightwellii TaxID=49249 RepID=A0A7S4V2L5_9STRA
MDMLHRGSLNHVSKSESEADETMMAQLQRRVYSLDPKKMANRKRSSSFSRPPKPPTDAQPDPEASEPSDLPQPFAQIESYLKKDMLHRGSLNHVSKSESEADETMMAQLQRRVYSLDSKKMANKERSSSFSRPPKPPTDAQSEPEISESFSYVEIRSIDDIAVEVSHVNKWWDNTERSVGEQSIQQRLRNSPLSDINFSHVTCQCGDSFPTVSHIETSESFEPGDSPQSDAQSESNRKPDPEASEPSDLPQPFAQIEPYLKMDMLQ